MPAEEFWEGDPWLAVAYREAHDLRRQQTSEELWLAGLYNFNAVSTAVNNVVRKKGTNPQKYTEHPIRVIPLTEQEKQANAERERQRTIDYLNKWAKAWEKKQKK